MSIHSKKPVRRVGITQPKYKLYRDDLRIDFNTACGYCDDSDLRADRVCFHIDHFAPRKFFPHLEHTYSNLIYACRFCNSRKSDYWFGENESIPHNGVIGLIDPCSIEYDVHLERDSTGRILGRTDLGRYIVNRLCLNLLRHQILWKARRALILRNEISVLLTRYQASALPKNNVYIELLERFYDLTNKIDEYEFSTNHG